jgi:aminoglycoside phosphotransferase (APT) family kinase protein
MPTPDVTELDTASLERYLTAEVTGFKGPLKAEKFGGGQSNPTFLLTSPSGRFVLRRKPPGKLLKSAHAVDREYRVMRSLGGTPVPVPRMVLLCTDDSIIGAMFFVMEFVEGRVFWAPALPELDTVGRMAVYDEMNKALAALHKTDFVKLGLSDFGRPGSYFERQMSRWGDQYRASETSRIAEVETLLSWLKANVPADDGRVCLVHGDYRLDNMIFAKDAPRLLALIDWELSTLGHPFSDIAYQCMQWRLPNEGVFRGLGGIDRRSLGIPTEEEYVARYCQRTGISGIPIWTFCLAFNFFRLLAILQGVYKRTLDGNASNPERGRKMGASVPVLARMAVDLIEGRGKVA